VIPLLRLPQPNLGGGSIGLELLDEVELLVRKYPGLSFEATSSGYEVAGPFRFTARRHDLTISDEYSIRIHVPSAYPHEIPVVFECSDRIPTEFDHKYKDNSLCLATDMDLTLSLSRDPSLVGFVDRYVVGYFYAVSYYRKYGVYPFGERSHGVDGLYEYYFELFQTDRKELVRGLLLKAYKREYVGHLPCLCGSGLKLRDCHGRALLPIIRDQDLRHQAVVDLEMMVRDLEESR
jgi:hypothetical protein